MYERGEMTYEGKTKRVYDVLGFPGLSILENKPDTTAFNNPAFTKLIQGKDVSCTTVTSQIFRLLQLVGIPVAFVEQISPTEMVVEKAQMIQLECICRRIAVPSGSYAARCPWEKRNPPRRFHRLVTEYFLKTTKGRLEIDGKILLEGLTEEEDDPIIINPQEEIWQLFHPALPQFHPGANLSRTVPRSTVLKNIQLADIDLSVRKSFLFLEGVFNYFGLRLSDFKEEYGVTGDGRLVIADVLDPDSWRLQTWDWIGFDKQTFRDGLDPKQVGKRYDIIAKMSEFFRIPRQALVIWKASKDDPFDLPKELPPGVELVEIIGSGHKMTNWCLAELENIQRDFPDGGGIIIKVGRSNGIGPTVASHTIWPVASVSADWKEKPQNIWSSLDMPSRNPHAAFLYDGNAVQFIMGYLAQKNPAVHMDLQFAIENLDTGY